MSDSIFYNPIIVICGIFVLIFASFLYVVNEQAKNQKIFMESCLHDKNKYECDVLWAQTRESKLVSEMATYMAVGAVVGSITSKR